MKAGLRWSEAAVIFFSTLSLILVFSIGTVGAVQMTAAVNIGADSTMIQFKAGDHILGFLPDRAYLASLDHALSVLFLGTQGVTPQSATPPPVSGAFTKAVPLGKVVYQNLWDGISLTYVATEAGITESTYHVAPGADVSRIRLRYNVPVEMRNDGSLQFKFNTGNLTESAPIAWQEIEGRRKPVKVAFKIAGDEVGFSVGRYDHHQPLVIDPTYSWHTFYGSGGGTTYGTGIALDSNGNIYVTGYSSASWGSPLHSNGNNFVLKLNSSGVRQWHTFYSGTSSSSDAGIAVDGSGNIYVTGYSYASWNGPGACTIAGTSPCPRNSFSGSYDIYVLKLNTDGAYQWHTFYGSSGYDLGHGIAVDGSGNVYVTGQSDATWGSPLHPYGSGWYNLFVLKLDSSGAHQWHTFYGAGSSSDMNYGNSIALDDNGNIYVAGKSDTTWGAPRNGHTAGDTDVFVLKLDNSGTYQWHTFYGPSNTNHGVGLALDSDSNVYVTGSGAAWGGTSLHDTSGGWDVFVLKLNSEGTHQWHTFYGSGNDEYGYGIAVDNSGNSYVTGTGNGNWGSPLRAYSGNSDAFLFKLDTNGAFKWNTFYGSGSGDEGWSVAMDSSGKVYLTGGSYTSWGSPSNPFIGSEDVFVVRTNDSQPVVTTTAISAITQNSAASGGNVISDGGDTVTARGVCWNTSINPTISNDHTTNGSGIGIFTSQFDSLSPVTTYHVRAYATNGGGTFYGEDISFTTTLCTNDVMRGGTSYANIHDALQNGSGAEITAVSRVFVGDILFSNSSALALLGGFSCGYGSINGMTTVQGAITLAGNASVTMGNIAVF